jgi:hypothetical protein
VPAPRKPRPRIFANIAIVEDALAAIDAADEAARFIALRTTSPDILAEADLIRQKLALVWRQLDAERQTYGRKSPTPPEEGDAGQTED